MDNLSKRLKILLAAATLWPFVYFGLIMLFALSVMAAQLLTHRSPDYGPPGGILLLIILPIHLLTILVWNALMIFYIVHVITTKRVTKSNDKALWAVVIFVLNILIMPVYWYLYIWCEPRPAPEAG